MGASAHKLEFPSIEDHSPPIGEYDLLGRDENFSLWYNPLLRNSLIEISFMKNDNSNILQEQIESYLWRHRHYLLVSTLFYKEKDENLFSIYYERIITNLSRIKDLTFEDSLMFYYVGLRAFQLLYDKFGFFDVQEEMFHITENNKVKIWCDKNISRIYPPAKGYGSEEAMVRKIIHIISSNTDPNQLKVPIGAFLNQELSCTFHNTINKFRTISKQFNLAIPNELTCLQTLRNGGILKMVDEFAIQEQIPSTFNEKEIIRKSSQTKSNHGSETKIKTYESLVRENRILKVEERKVDQKSNQHFLVNSRSHSLPSAHPPKTTTLNNLNPIIRQINIQPVHQERPQTIRRQIVRPQSLEIKKSEVQTPQRNSRVTMNTTNSQKIVQIPQNHRIITFNRSKSFEKLIPEACSSTNLAKPPIPPNRFIPRLQSPPMNSPLINQLPIIQLPINPQAINTQHINTQHINTQHVNTQKIIFKPADLVKENSIIKKRIEPEIFEIKEEPNPVESIEKEVKEHIHDVSIDRALEQLEKIEKINGMGMPSRENLFSGRGLSEIDDKLTSFDILEPITEMNVNFKEVKSETFLFEKNTSTNLVSAKLLESRIEERIKFFEQKAAQMKESFKTEKTIDHPTKKYIPQIDDDIWKDLQLMKTRKKEFN